ncbi:hypothetical protein OsI_30843 [Oryza sativa Indica Group]|jgi:hypothetical protein|uniref:Uncharacterized protein n=1 Tax=Oryza sativa subsp. indica TaxID=39946 RepID=B8BE96_ORYSI|nr:hypothetical protein OsI_30843 [Oryza sativa Indica Group]
MEQKDLDFRCTYTHLVYTYTAEVVADKSTKLVDLQILNHTRRAEADGGEDARLVVLKLVLLDSKLGVLEAVDPVAP